MSEAPAGCELSLTDALDVLQRAGLVRTPWSTRPQGRGNVVVDSRKLRPGDLFLAFRGVSSDAHGYVETAIAKGAGLLVVERADAVPAGAAVPTIVVSSGRAAWAHLAAHANGNPQDALTMLAVTGTNGKTSTVWMIGELLRGSGVPCLTLGTLGADFGDGPEPTGHTTPDPDRLYAALAAARARGIRHVAMEASSHAIAQEKLRPIRYDGCAFTSFSRDHLDFHDSLEDYWATKVRLFTTLAKPTARHVIWAGLEDRGGLEGLPGEVWRYGIGGSKPLDFELTVLSESFEGSQLGWRSREARGTLVTPYFGRHAIENFAAAYLSASAVAGPFSPETLARMRHVPGRLQRVSTRIDEPQVVVDYAHTPDALEKTLEVLRPLCKGRLVAVFGCGGDRDPGKRPMMGKSAEERADRVYLTSDNPRSEDPEKILDQIAAGLAAPSSAVRIADRRAAIFAAVRDAAPDDTVLVAGKGHETYQLIGGRTLAFDDRLVAAEALATRRT